MFFFCVFRFGSLDKTACASTVYLLALALARADHSVERGRMSMSSLFGNCQTMRNDDNNIEEFDSPN